MCEQPEWADLPAKEWLCEHCGAKNWWEDADCQFCDAEEPEEQEVA